MNPPAPITKNPNPVAQSAGSPLRQETERRTGCTVLRPQERNLNSTRIRANATRSTSAQIWEKPPLSESHDAQRRIYPASRTPRLEAVCLNELITDHAHLSLFPSSPPSDPRIVQHSRNTVARMYDPAAKEVRTSPKALKDVLGGFLVSCLVGFSVSTSFSVSCPTQSCPFRPRIFSVSVSRNVRAVGGSPFHRQIFQESDSVTGRSNNTS